VLPALSVPLAVLAVTVSLLGPTAAPSPVWTAPVVGPVLVLQPFDPPPEPWLPGHRGVDLDADVGDPVLAAGAGTVTWAAPIAGRGVVVVLHEDGRRTTYEPVDPSVSVGDAVEAGDPLGVIAPGVGHCGGVPSCLHWGLRRGEDYLDPMLLLRRGRPVLLP
jgi:murein DD-endopeptidase MepM/ murein hydrolase activator NlpD